MLNDHDAWDLICVGTGFASTFFCKKFLELNPAARVLFLERGAHVSHDVQLTTPDYPWVESPAVFTNATAAKPWYFKLMTGGSSNCWAGSTPRWHPHDFKLRSLYGQAVDWPFDYDELEPYYAEAEQLMLVAGSQQRYPYPRSEPHPLPPHRMSDPCVALMNHYPELWFPLPSARATRPNPGRGQCCHSMRCNLCPVNAKFTVLNGMTQVLQHPQVTLINHAEVLAVDTVGGLATGVLYKDADGQETRIRGELVALGANAIMNPFLLLKSGLTTGGVGTGLCEQAGFGIDVLLNGMKSGQGSTSSTAIGYNWYNGDFRKEFAGAMILSNSRQFLRPEKDRWQERHVFNVAIEDLPQAHNKVSIDPAQPDRPKVEFHGESAYAQAGVQHWQNQVEKLLAPLPVESITLNRHDTEYHIQCSTRMGADPATSVVDANCVHHAVRNLLVLGASVFPTASPAHPTLTLAAVSLRAAHQLLGSHTS